MPSTTHHYDNLKVVYTAPNRGHHFNYAKALHAAGCLHTFVSGFPRLSIRSRAPELEGKIYHADFLQTIYLFSLRINMPTRVSEQISFWAKKTQDAACSRFMKDCNIFLFYNGSGLSTCRKTKKNGVISVVEAVNSHVTVQENILRQEYDDTNLTWRPFPKNEVRRRLLEYDAADYILMPSEFVRKSFLEQGFPQQKLLKVPYGFNKYENQLTLDDLQLRKSKTFTVLYVGSISVRKGVRYLIEAFQRITVENKKLVIVGPDVDDGALSTLTLSEDICFLGVLKGKELEDAYKNADVFCLPSIEEGFALVIGEAISFGLPIVATENTGADELITDGNEGYLLPIKDSKAIAEKLQLLADDPDLLLLMRSKALSKSKNLDGWQQTGERLVQVMHQLTIQKT